MTPSAREMPRRGWLARHPLVVVAVAPLLAQMIGSAFNIWFNIVHIRPLLTRDQLERFLLAIHDFNAVAYSLPLLAWIAVIISLRRPMRALAGGGAIAAGKQRAAQRRVVNLPWWSVIVAGPPWIATIPYFLGVLSRTPQPVAKEVLVHLSASLAISAIIAITHGCFVAELACQQLLFPVFFPDSQPHDIPKTHPLSLRGRSLLWSVCVVVCPLISLVLVVLEPHPEAAHNRGFALILAGLGICYGMTSAMLIGFFVVEPVRVLESAAERVAKGDLDVEIDLIRADEFGALVASFRRMIGGLREKERIRRIFGQHVGAEAAREILEHNPGLGGKESEITVMFGDIRNFTARCSRCTAREGVELVNLFLTEAVAAVEGHGGILNRFLGDGFMAIFGAAAPQPDHAARAIASGLDLLKRMDGLNKQLREKHQPPLQIGLGLHTGNAIVGSVGAPSRMEFTAIGDTVNLASRVESLTKEFKHPLLFTAETLSHLTDPPPCEPMPPTAVKGKPEPLTVYGLISPP